MERILGKPAYVEHLYLEPTETAHSEMYLKAIYLLKESNESPAKVTSIAKLLGISPSSVVEMLRRLDKSGLVKYSRKGASLTKKGHDIGKAIVRNTRLVEALMALKLKIPVNERISCGMEHIMTQEFSDSLCSLLKHPKRCPHGFEIPPGKCCK